MKRNIVKILFMLFSILFLFYPTSYGFNFKYSMIFLIILGLLYFLYHKFNINIKIPEKYFLFLIVLLSIITRIGIVILLNNNITQISNFEEALNAAKTNWFSGPYYQVFTHWILYPKMLSQVFKIFGASQLVALLTNAGILIITTILVYKNASLILNNKRKGFYAALIYIFWPSNILYTTIVTPEHFCSLLLMTVLFLFLILVKKDFYCKKIYKTIILSIIIGIILGLSTFFKNFAYVFLIGIFIFLIISSLNSNKISKRELLLKLISFLLMVASFFVTTDLIFDKIENDYLKAKVVRNVTPCYLNVGFRDQGVYSKENYDMYFEAFERNNYDYKKTNSEILEKLKYHLTQEVSNEDIKELLDSKAKIIYGNDESKITFTTASITDQSLAEFINNNILDLNNFYFAILVLLSILGLIKLNKERDLKLFLNYLLFFGTLCTILLVEGQNRYMYALQPLLCIAAVSGLESLIAIFKKNIKLDKRKIIKSKVDYRSIFYSGFFILTFIGLNILISSTMFIFNIGISKWYFWISLIVSTFLIYILLKKQKIINIKTILISIILPIVLIFSLINLVGKFYDYTWDGNMYHKAAISYLMEGWNPLKEDVNEYDSKSENPKDLLEWSYLWINHYPKASYLFGANVGVITNSNETGKSINILSIFVCFSFVLSFLIYKKKDKLFSILFSIIVVSCTTIGSQIFTNFIDGLVYIYFFLLIWFFFANENQKYLPKRDLYISYGLILMMLINIKFSSFAYAGILCLCYYIWYIIRLIKKDYNKKEFIRFTYVSIITLLISVFIVGLSSYPKNLLEKGNAFYPLMGEGKKEIMLQETLYYLEDASPIKKLIVSNYSEALNLSRASQAEARYKIPFSIHENELNETRTCDLRISGNGLLFSGIFTISLIVFIFYIIREIKNDKKNFILMIIPFGITIIMAFTMQDLWWARYFPHIHLIVFGSLLLLNKYRGLDKSIIMKFLIIVILLNNGMFLFGNLDRARQFTYDAKVQYEQFKQQWSPEDCKMQIYSLIFPGGYFNIEQELPEYEKQYTSTPLDEDYQYILNGGYASGICKESEK